MLLRHPGVNEYERFKTRQLLASALHWYRADTVTLSGANLATMPNRGTVGGAMTVTLGTLAAPAPDAQLGGAPSVAFTGTQQMQSNLPASAFSYMHQNGHSFAIYTGRTGDANLFTTRNGFVTPSDTGARCMEWGGLQHCEAMNAGVTSYLASRPYPTPDISAVLEFAVGGQSYPPGFACSNAVAFGDLTAGAAATSSPELPLTFGNVPDSLPNTNLRIAEFLSFDRRLLPYERQLIQDYVRTRYNISLPTMTGIDREVLKLNPYSWIRADRYVENTGKVSGLPDLVLPLHSMVQGTAANQCDVPVTDAGFNGQLVMPFAGNQWYDSNFPAAAWNFCTDGSGVSYHCPVVHTYSSTAQTTSGNGVGGTSWNMMFYQAAPDLYVQPGASSIITLADGGPPDVPVIVHVRIGLAESPQMVVRSNHLEASSSFVPPTGTSGSSMRIGARSDGFCLTGKMPESIFLNRYPTAQELATIDAYHLQRYGLTS